MSNEASTYEDTREISGQAYSVVSLYAIIKFCRNFLQLIFSGEPSGRLLKYSQITKETTVLLRGLQFPNGVSMSKDGSFFLFCEGSRGRLVGINLNLY